MQYVTFFVNFDLFNGPNLDRQESLERVITIHPLKSALLT